METSSIFLIGKALHVLALVAVFVFSLFVYKYNPKQTENRLVLLVCSTLCLCLLMTASIELSAYFLGKIPVVFPIIEFIAAAFAHPLSLHFIVHQARQYQTYKPVLIGSYTIATFFAIAGLFQLQYQRLAIIDDILVREFSSYFVLYGVFTMISNLISIAIIWKTLKSTQNIYQRQQFKLFMASFIITGALIFVLGFIFPVVLGISESVYFVGLGALGFIFIPYSTIRYQYLDIKTAFHYSLIWGITLLIFSLPIVFAPILVKNSFNYPYAPVIWGLIVAVYVLSIQKTILPKIEKLSKRKRIKLDDVLTDFIHVIESTERLGDLQTATFHFLNSSIYTQDIGIYLFESDQSFQYALGKQKIQFAQPINKDFSFTPKLIHKKYFQKLNFCPISPSTHEITIIARLESDSTTIGFLLLTEKSNFQDYDYDDLKFIEHVAELISVQLKKINQLTRAKTVTNEIIHELKNTSMGLQYTVSTLASKANATLEEKQMLQDMLVEMSKLYRFSRKHLALEVLDKTDSLDIQEYCLADLIQGASIPCKHKMKEKHIGIDLKFDLGLKVFGDEALLKIVFTNLIENAVKFLDKPKNIEVHTQTNAHTIKIEFKDHGPGMPKNEQKNLNKKWYVKDGNYISSGLGLPLCRKIIEKHQGKLSIHSVLGEGTTISIELPKPH